jgi:hypothetical protein
MVIVYVFSLYLFTYADLQHDIHIKWVHAQILVELVVLYL